jgi:hypothetical protein
MHVDPKLWGKQFWFVLHTISFTYPENPNDSAKRKYYDLIQNLPLFLPNQKIATDFTDILDKYPVKPYLDSRAMFVKWMHFIHNEINKITGKEEMDYYFFLENMSRKLSSQEDAHTIPFTTRSESIFLLCLVTVTAFIFISK